MTKACEKPCRECPFRREAAPGYLGAASGDPNGFVAPHWHGPVPLPCHMAVNWDADEDLVEVQIEEAPLCKGLLIMAKNSAKYLDAPGAEECRRNTEADRDLVFSMLREFVNHHSRPPSVEKGNGS